MQWRGEMRLAGAGAADEHDVTLLGEEAPARQVTHKALVDGSVGEGEVADVLG